MKGAMVDLSGTQGEEGPAKVRQEARAQGTHVCVFPDSDGLDPLGRQFPSRVGLFPQVPSCPWASPAGSASLKAWPG